MHMLKEVLVASALTVAAIMTAPPASSHEIKVGSLVIVHPWLRPSPAAAGTAAGFMTIRNSGSEDDTLISASSTVAPVVQLHEMTMQGEVMTMKEVTDGIVIPAGGSVKLKPGGLHIMFMNVPSQPEEGTEVPGTLIFQKAGTVDIEYEVSAPGAEMSTH